MKRIDISIRMGSKIRSKLYCDNLLHFFGKTNTRVDCLSPENDNPHKWSCKKTEVTKIIEKWYKILEFPKEFDKEFYTALNTVNISDAITIESFIPSNDGKRNLLSFLYMCENLSKSYKEKKISGGILIDTLKDIVIWNNIWSDIKGELYLGECSWLAKHLSGKLYKLGRLQFCMGYAHIDIPEEDLKKGDMVIEVHIPECGPLDITECEKSIERAKKFFKKYFPGFKYKCFTCHSWLLDDSLREILKPTSNILAFQSLFDIRGREESDAIFKYVFSWNTTREKLLKENALTSFAAKVKELGIKGVKFYENTGILKNSKY